MKLHPAADGFRDGAETRDEIGENFGQDRLFAIALRALGRIVDLDHHGVSARGHSGERHLRNVIAKADAVGRVDHDGQMCLRLQ